MVIPHDPGNIKDMEMSLSFCLVIDTPCFRLQKHHYRELPDDLTKSLGRIPDEFVTYFTSRFPKMLLHSYLTMMCVKDEIIFSKYYA